MAEGHLLTARPGPPRRSRGRAGLAAAVVLALWAGVRPAPAPVFWNWGRSADHGSVSSGQPGWASAYRTTLRINGGAARVEVLGVSFGLADAVRSIEATYRGMGATVHLAGAPSLAWGYATWPDRVVTLLAFPVHAGPECLVVRLDQTRDEFRRALERPAAHALRDVPPLPGSEPRLYVADEGADLEMEISEAGGDASGAQGFFESALVSDGWLPLLPADPRAPSRPMTFYARGRDVCVVQAQADASGRTLVTRVLKRLGSDSKP